MARIDWISDRLNNWARWKLLQGASSMARVNLLNADMPLAPYADKPIPITDCEASDTDEAVQQLVPELRLTVLVYYLDAGGIRQKLTKLQIGESTLHARIDRAQRLLADHFNARRERANFERNRVENLSKLATKR